VQETEPIFTDGSADEGVRVAHHNPGEAGEVVRLDSKTDSNCVGGFHGLHIPYSITSLAWTMIVGAVSQPEHLVGAENPLGSALLYSR
jgi:hypothetical protein